jgi:hypothetical protein
VEAHELDHNKDKRDETTGNRHEREGTSKGGNKGRTCSNRETRQRAHDNQITDVYLLACGCDDVRLMWERVVRCGCGDG